MADDAGSAGLSKDEAYALAELADYTLIDYIRENCDVDSMEWLKNVVRGYEKLCEVSGYVGLTERGKE